MSGTLLTASVLLLALIAQQDSPQAFDDMMETREYTKCNDTELSTCLCEMNRSSTDRIVIGLSGMIEYSFNPRKTCNVSKVKLFKLVGPWSMARISCRANNSGIIVLSEIENLQLVNIHFTGCGDTIASMGSHDQIERGQKAVLYIQNSGRIIIDRVSITEYQGYAILAVQVHQIRIDTLRVSNTSCTCPISTSIACSCSGLVIMSCGTQDSSKTRLHFSLRNSEFHMNVNAYSPCINKYSRLMGTKDYSMPQHVSASITLILHQTIIEQITMDGNKLLDNYGIQAAGILIISSDTVNPYVAINITNSYFERNRIMSIQQISMGSSISMIFITKDTPTAGQKNNPKIDKIDIPKIYIYMYNNTTTRQENQSGIFIQSSKKHQLEVNITELKCAHNTPSLHGICLQAKAEQDLLMDDTERKMMAGGTFKIYLNSIKAFNNGKTLIIGSILYTFKHLTSRTVLFTFTNIQYVEITGTNSNPSHFYQNHASVFTSIRSQVIFTGTITFEDISFTPVLYFVDSSYLILKPKLNISFIGQYESDKEQPLIQMKNNPSDTLESLCALQILCHHRLSNNQSCEIQRDEYSIKLYYKSIIEIVPAYGCKLMDQMVTPDSAALYRQVFGRDTVVRSNAIRAYLMEGDKLKTGRISYNVSDIYPGYYFTLCIALMDYVGNAIPGTIEIKIQVHKGFPKKVYFFNNKTSLVFMLYSFKHCTNYPLKVYSYDECSIPTELIIAESGMQPTLVLDINVASCPYGFQLIKGECKCGPFMEQVKEKHPYDNTRCRIKKDKKSGTYSILLSVKNFFWLGFANEATIAHSISSQSQSTNTTEDSMLLYTAICPLGYCNSTQDYVDMTILDDLCVGNRVGQVCSQCRENYSMVFGYSHCEQCSNAWLWSIPVYALLGVVLVAVLLIFNLTINHGPVTSVILFCNIALFGQSDIRKMFFCDKGYYVKTMMVSLVNLKIGYPLCLYDGMTETVKIGLELVFPVYTWLLVVLIIVISRYSTSISNWIANRSVQVLVTIWHLSYIKILITVVNVFTPLYALIENKATGKAKTVWLWNVDPGIPYGSTWGHITLLVIATIFLILYIIPYLFLSMYVPFCWKQRWIIRFRPIFETMYGPYKRKYSMWFGVRLATVTILAAISVSIQGSNMHFVLLLYQTTLILLTLTQAFINPFKNKLVAVVDLILLSDVTLLYVLVGFEALHDMLYSIFLTTSVLYALMNVLTITIVVYHCIRYVRPVNACVISIINHVKQHETYRQLLEILNNNYNENNQALRRGNYDEEDNDLREPLLSDNFD